PVVTKSSQLTDISSSLAVVSCDMSQDFTLPITFPAGYSWDGNTPSLNLTGSRAGDASASVKGTPTTSGGQLQVTAHVGVSTRIGTNCGNLQIQASANFIGP